MKKIAIILVAVILVAATAFFAFLSYTKSKSPEQTTSLDVSGGNISVTYSSPSKRGRVIFGDLVPYGQVWRTGANEATVITFSKDVVFGGTPVKAGSYSLWTIPNQDAWAVILNTETGQWGTNYDGSTDLLKIVAPVIKQESSLESFAIHLISADMGATLRFAWDDVQVDVPISVNQ